jgi:EF hand
MKQTLLAIALTFAAGTVAAEGETGFMPWTTWMKDVWAAYDMNKDGGLSMSEVTEMSRKLGEDMVGFQPWYMDHFAKLDTDKDGIVTAEELHAMMEADKMTDAEVVKAWLRGVGFMPFNQEKPGDRG